MCYNGVMREESAEQIRQQLKRLLSIRELSHAQVAVKSGIPRSNISKFLDGRRNEMGIGAVIEIARALDVSLDWLAGLPKGNPRELEPDEKRLLELYRRLPPDGQRLMLGTMTLAARIRTGNEEGTGAERL